MTSSDTNFLTLENIDLSLSSQSGQVDILKNISLSEEKGEKIAIFGPSGSGKSSLMMIMAGLQRPSAGLVKLSGCALNDLDEAGLTEFRRENIGIVFQNFHLVPTMTALENTALPLEFSNKFSSKDEVFKKAEDVLTEVGLSHRLSHYPSQLSGGEQQRVALARALVASPKIILADEPTGNLDQETGEQIIQLLFRLADQSGMTLILITHDPDLAARCSKQIKLVDGKIENTGKV